MKSQTPSNRNATISRVLQELLDLTVAEEPGVRGGVLLVETPTYRWKGARGLANSERGIPICADDQFHVASITKMFTAATALALVEAGAVGLDEGIGRYLPDWDLSRLHVVGDRSYGAGLTLRQVLGHTSGLADFFGDGKTGPDGLSPFLALLLREQSRFWSSRSVLTWTEGNLSSHCPPGSRWKYCDTGYLLAGLVVEAVTGSQLHEVMADKLFEPLGMTHTYMAFRQRPTPNVEGKEPSSAYIGNVAYSQMRSASADWAGGGLITTAEDLTRFIRAFAAGRVHRDRATSEQMLAWNPTGEEGVYYGLGVRRFVPEELGMPGLAEVWGHTGFVRSFMLYCPELEASVCGTLNQSRVKGTWSELYPVASLVPAVLSEVKNAAV